jgi:hypothetical protein
MVVLQPVAQGDATASGQLKVHGTSYVVFLINKNIYVLMFAFSYT